MRAERRRTAGVLLMAGVLLLSGCASMPSGGKVDRVDSSHRTEGESRVRVFGVSPQKGEGPQEIVRGFLEATTSDEPRYATASEYLTEEAAKKWDPFQRTTVVTAGPNPGASQRDGGEGRGYTVEVGGRRTAIVDSKHSYDSEDGDYDERFHLTKLKEGWRIDKLPDGVILSESDFERIYRSVNVYYYARLGADAEAVSRGEDVLVADPVYVRGRIDPVTETVEALIEGPTDWLEPVVTSAFPAGTELAGKDKQHLSLDDSGRLTVRLNARGARASRPQCARMAAQVLHSVQSQGSATVSRVALEGPGGDDLCELSQEAAESYAPGKLNGRGARQYFIDGEHRVAALTSTSEDTKVVEGALGSGKVEMGSVAVSRDERQGAAVSLNGRSLYVAPLEDGGELGKAVLHSEASQEKDRLTAPSWDGLGDLWIADRDPGNPRLLRVRGGKEKPEEVDVPGLSKGERVESLKISSDGVRIAVRVREPDGRRSLHLGRVERWGSPDDPQIEIAALQAAAPQFEDVIATSWAGDSQLVVVGRETESVQQLQYVGTDGSTTNQPTLPGINDVTGVAASEDEGRPLLAESAYGIVRLPPDENWKTLTDKGTAPVYPG
ncbi:LpqB family beta-propeller domain-containing protein [Streptomyces sp. N2-109]|uniref:LpqB family beta-propeller domain-containing protein n=1 Tax=Streptomyces gossypii TaxID=2883101 RepID=A0ABT2JTX4_9ACTN|nr:LpqB family beta-propeller domain-containing protein [Streptomyces gossypii]MCT2591328.1 LpqB family beta-propeller domain-containing protein [Streptomyces gossypii]